MSIEITHINKVKKQPNPEKFYWFPTRFGFAPNTSKNLKKREKKVAIFLPIAHIHDVFERSANLGTEILENF